MSHWTNRHGRQDVSRGESLAWDMQDFAFNDVEYSGVSGGESLTEHTQDFAFNDVEHSGVAGGESLTEYTQDFAFNDVEYSGVLGGESLTEHTQDFAFNDVEHSGVLGGESLTEHTQDFAFNDVEYSGVLGGESLAEHTQDFAFNDAEYLGPDEERDPCDSQLTDPRCYGLSLGRWVSDRASNQHYCCGNANFDYIKTFWPNTIPRHYTWTGEHLVDQRKALEGLQQNKGINLINMAKNGRWLTFTSMYQGSTVPFIVTITYSKSNPPLTLSYAILRQRGSRRSVVGFKLDPNPSGGMTLVSRYEIQSSCDPTNTVRFLKPVQRPHEWSVEECTWWVPRDDDPSLRDRLHFSPHEVAERSGRRLLGNQERAGHRHRHRQ